MVELAFSDFTWHTFERTDADDALDLAVSELEERRADREDLFADEVFSEITLGRI